jgi:predicted transposase YbfD/YdcC
MAIMDQKEGTARCEQTAALALLERLPALDGQTVTADPLHCQKKVARTIVEKGGEYLLQIKGNQPTLQQHAQRVVAATTPLFAKPISATAGTKNGA